MAAIEVDAAAAMLWDYEHEGWAHKFFDNWRGSLSCQRLKSYEKFAEVIDRHWGGIAAYCKAENKVSWDSSRGLTQKFLQFSAAAYGLRDEENLRLKILTCTLPEL
jgi:hypothetical protein